MAVAELLGKFEHEILQLSPPEFARWLAYLQIKRKEERKARARANKKVTPVTRRTGRRR